MCVCNCIYVSTDVWIEVQSVGRDDSLLAKNRWDYLKKFYNMYKKNPENPRFGTHFSSMLHNWMKYLVMVGMHEIITML